MDYTGRIEAIRSMMASHGWDAVVISGSDPHSSEYPADRWKCVQWISGFTGEAGDIVITADHAGLWTDTRYFIQARRQLAGTGIELHKTRIPEQVLIPEWIAARFNGQDSLVIAVDGLCQQAGAVLKLKATLIADGRSENPEDERNFSIIDSPDMLSTLWADRPAIPCTPVTTVPAGITGETRLQRIQWLRRAIAEKNCDSVLLTSLDEIAWTLNVRGSDIEYNPMVISFLLITPEEVNWYVRKELFGDNDDPQTLESFVSLEQDGINILPYDDIQLALNDYLSEHDTKLFVDPATLNWNIYSLINASGRTVEGESPVQLRKAVKTSSEIAGMRKAHLQDGIAMEKFLYWLDKSVSSDRRVTEWDAAVKLGKLRSEQPDYLGDSFETISAFAEGGALPHYVTPRTDAPVLEARGLYLCDSGGQYSCGTTDITRTVPLGPCTALEMEDYTLVLKGHIALAMAVWPEGTAGCQIDVLARNPLWQCKRNFGHGTGHGIGFYLGVHEGPQDIRQNFNRTALLPGMITSDEPGIYREGMYGIRHENLVLCVPAGGNDFGRWLSFETLTLCHFDTSAVIADLLTREERAWLNAYNARVCSELSPHLPEDVRCWLATKTRAI